MTIEPEANPIQRIWAKIFASRPKNRLEEVLQKEFLGYLDKAEEEYRLACRINPNFDKSLNNLKLLSSYRRELTSFLR